MFMASQLRGRGASVTELIGDASKAWGKLSEAEKKNYESLAKADIKMFMDSLGKYLKA